MRSSGRRTLCLIALGAGLLAPGARPAAAQGEEGVPPAAAGSEGGVVKPIELGPLAGTVSAQGIKIPPGVRTLRVVTAPAGSTGYTVTVHIYSTGNANWADLFTQRPNQPPVLRNHVRLVSRYPVQQGATFWLVPHQPMKRKGWVVVLANEPSTTFLVLPGGFGGRVYQKEFLARPKGTARYQYSFDDVDSRGYLIVQARTESTGSGEAAGDIRYYVWNGRTFVPRA